MDDKYFDIPIVLVVFRRLDTVKLIMNEISKVKPKKIYVFSDGPRVGNEDEYKKVLEVRDYIRNAVVWNCDSYFEFSATNKGCATNICDGIDYVFKYEKRAIILEDDAVPMQEFFEFCAYLLNKYEDKKEIQYIGGFNAVGDSKVIKESYTFSQSAPMSGAIATWKDRWNECDFSMKNWPNNYKSNKLKKFYYYNELYKIHCKAYEAAYQNLNDGWDYQFHHDQLENDRFAIVPKGNLVKSYGYVEGAFHPQSNIEAKNLNKIMNYTKCAFDFPMIEPEEIKLNIEYDRLRQKLFLEVKGKYIQRHVYYLYRNIKDFAYKYMPKAMWNGLKRIVSNK